LPWIIDYPIVLEQMRQMQMRSLYFNGGAFGFTAAPTQSIGWIGPADETIRPEMRHFTRQAPPPYEPSLTDLLLRTWREVLPGRIWVMPGSHWAYELDFGSRDWMPPLLEAIGVDPGLLQNRTNAAAIEFTPEESPALSHLVSRLLEMLQTSDFAIAFPHRRITCTLHHHKQLWWTTPDADLFAAIEGMLPKAKDER
jgi:hypothetical protein